MKTLLIILLSVLFLSGCAHVKVTKQLPDGTIITAEYTRWLNQQIDGFELETPDGTKVKFARTKSATEIALEIMGYTLKMGEQK